jgi:hypothetical protein
MKKLAWPLAIFVLSILAWLSIIKLAPELAKSILTASGECPSGSIKDCKETLSALGAAGDTFGAVTSLFSGLALFAVSYTVWSDGQARREARKPLVTTRLHDSSIFIQQPRISPDQSAKLKISPEINSKNGEAALNVAVYCEIVSEKVQVASFLKHLSQPLVSDGVEEFEVIVEVKGSQLASLLSRLTEDQQPVILNFRIEYNSLENVRWETRVAYEVTCKEGDRRKRLNALRSSTDDFVHLWDHGADVSLDARVQDGSWAHAKK